MRTSLAALLLGTVLLPTTAPVAAGAAPREAIQAPHDASQAPRDARQAPRAVNGGYSIPVAGVTDLGALPVLGSLGLDFARLLTK
ncbi:hypothetical protein [Kitasatospora brasiliensis]|uniref:hypothetical protein n=1 Tax=Kitasatospora brasiliensis TaxID=3058040 RepID=UPI00292EA9CB|nr:hypothetical protein [Kitasatospora sp. K002]